MKPEIDIDAPSRALKVILVEDDDADAKAVRRAFRKVKLANPITRVIDGIEALELLRGEGAHEGAAAESPFVLLVDINMPRMNGHEFVAELRADPKLRKLVVFMLTTSEHDDDLAAAYNNNVAGYVLKQRAGEDFIRLTGMLDAYWRVVEMP